MAETKQETAYLIARSIKRSEFFGNYQPIVFWNGFVRVLKNHHAAIEISPELQVSWLEPMDKRLDKELKAIVRRASKKVINEKDRRAQF